MLSVWFSNYAIRSISLTTLLTPIHPRFFSIPSFITSFDSFRQWTSVCPELNRRRSERWMACALCLWSFQYLSETNPNSEAIKQEIHTYPPYSWQTFHSWNHQWLRVIFLLEVFCDRCDGLCSLQLGFDFFFLTPMTNLPRASIRRSKAGIVDTTESPKTTKASSIGYPVFLTK